MTSYIPQIPVHYLVTAGEIVLPLAFTFRLVKALRAGESLEPVFAAFALGVLGLAFYSSGFYATKELGELLEKKIRSFGNPDALKLLVWRSIQEAGNEADANGHIPSVTNLPAIVEQIFRTGVWGITSSIADFFFLIAQAFIEIKRDVLRGLTQFLFPLFWGLFPIFPRLGLSSVVFLIEMALWGPCLVLIQLLVSDVAPKYLHRPGSLGIPIVALEIVATLLILNVPRTVHSLIQGSLQVGGESEALGLIFFGSRAVKAINRARIQAVSETSAKVILLFFFLFGSSTAPAFASTPTKLIRLYPGYVTQVHCKGRLFISAVGNPKQIRLEAFPKEMGCGVLLSPQSADGKSDLLLKTSTGDFHSLVEIGTPEMALEASDLEIWMNEMSPEKEAS